MTLEDLKKEFDDFKMATQSDLFELRRNQSSRRGVDGARGEKGDSGSPGRDATVKIVQDGQTVRVLSNNGTAEILTIPIAGRDGVDGRSPAIEDILKHVPIPKDGRDGKDAPSLTEIVEAVLTEFSARVKK